MDTFGTSAEIGRIVRTGIFKMIVTRMRENKSCRGVSRLELYCKGTSYWKLKYELELLQEVHELIPPIQSLHC